MYFPTTWDPLHIVQGCRHWMDWNGQGCTCPPRFCRRTVLRLTQRWRVYDGRGGDRSVIKRHLSSGRPLIADICLKFKVSLDSLKFKRTIRCNNIHSGPKHTTAGCRDVLCIQTILEKRILAHPSLVHGLWPLNSTYCLFRLGFAAENYSKGA